jgi:two-component system NarL family sensor kinase
VAQRAARRARADSRVRPMVAVALGIVVVVTALVLALRLTTNGREPPERNWWLVSEVVLGLAYLPVGAALGARRDRRLLGVLFVAVGATAVATALSTEYEAYAAGRDGPARWPSLAVASEWTWLLGGSVLATLVLLALLPPAWRADRWLRSTMVAAGAATAALVVRELTQPWPRALGSNPLQVTGSGAADLIDLAGRFGRVGIDVIAVVAVVLLAVRWRQRHRLSDDPLPAWLLAGGIVAVLAVVPPTTAVLGDQLPAPNVVAPVLLIATVPLLVVGALIEVVRLAPTGWERVSHRFLEWVLLAAGIIAIYTGLVAGLGRLVGGSGPTWFLVAATGAIAVLVEPARQRIRRLVDRLVYGSRDDTLTLVRQVMGHVSTMGEDQELLPALAASLGREMRLDAVAIDVAGPHGWERAATYGPDAPSRPHTGHRREIPLRHHDEVVGRLLVGWADAPSLRPRDEATLEELAAPLALAVSWVRLAADLRRTSLAVLSAREEERRRLRRDLHDGLGPALTGISLGLHTAIRQLQRAGADGTPLRLLNRLADEVDSTVAEVKRIVRDLRPTALDELGLVGAVAEFAHGFDDALQLHLELPRADLNLPAAVEVAVYRIVTEALTNVVRHAEAARCWLRIEASEVVEIEVVDDGVGLATGTPAGVGLSAMRERAAELGGTVTVGPRPPHGTRLHVRLPAALP